MPSLRFEQFCSLWAGGGRRNQVLPRGRPWGRQAALHLPLLLGEGGPEPMPSPFLREGPLQPMFLMCHFVIQESPPYPLLLSF